MSSRVLAFDLAYRTTGWATVTHDCDSRSWTVHDHGLVRGEPKSASPVTEHVRVQWAGSCLDALAGVISISSTFDVEAIIYESPQAWLLAKARSQKYRAMRTKTSKEAILGFGAARERLYQAIAQAYGAQAKDLVIIAVDPRRWQHVLDSAVLGDVTRLDRKAQDKRAVEILTGLDLTKANEDEVDAIGIGLWGSRALALGELQEAA